MVFVAASVLGVLFLIMTIVYKSKLKSVPKNELSETKQKVGIYSFGVVFAIGIAIFAKTQGI